MITMHVNSMGEMLGSTGSTLGLCIDKVLTPEDPSRPANMHLSEKRISQLLECEF